MLGPFYGSVTRLATGKYQWSASQLTLDDDTKQRAMQETAWADVSCLPNIRPHNTADNYSRASEE